MSPSLAIACLRNRFLPSCFCAQDYLSRCEVVSWFLCGFGRRLDSVRTLRKPLRRLDCYYCSLPFCCLRVTVKKCADVHLEPCVWILLLLTTTTVSTTTTTVSLTERSNLEEAARFSLVRPSCIHRCEENVLWLVSVCIAVTKAPLQQLFWCGWKAVSGTV